jgi:hypothetical protein
MSCGCSSTTTPSSSTSCGGCGYQCTSCICPADPIVMPTVTCPDPVACDEIFPLECIEYTGDDIKCSTTATTLYPNVTHVVATNGDTMTNVLNNINNQLCYLFSADYISRMLTNIKEDTVLSSLFCSIVCDSPPNALICPTVASVTYNYDSSTSQYYLAAQINYVPLATSYAYRFYTESVLNSGNFDTFIGGGTNIQLLSALPITLTSIVPTPTTYTSSKNYAVLVQATGSLTASGVAPINVPSNPFIYSTVAADNPNNCGINKYVGTPSQLLCRLADLNGNFKQNGIKNVQFIFSEETLNPISYPPTSYIIHYYLKSISMPYVYNYLNIQTISTYTPGALHTITLNKSTVSGKTWVTTGSTTATITSTAHGMSSGTIVTISVSSNTTNIPNGDYIITVVNANTFIIPLVTTASAGSGTLSHTIPVTSSDVVVVMIRTTTANPETCSKGIPTRINSFFTDVEIAGYLSNPSNNVFKYP